MRTRHVVGTGLAALALVAMPLALYAVFFIAPMEKVMGMAQKIFYIHVAAAMNMLLAFGVCGVASVLFLAVRSTRVRRVADAVSVATAEVGVMLGAIVLSTGPLWAKKAWGTWWTFEPRLTLSLLVFFLFLAYLALRAFAGSERFGRSVAAGLAVMGLPGIYFIHVAVERFGGAHPQVVYKGGLSVPGMVLAFWLSVVAMALLSASLAWQRAALELKSGQVDALFLDLDRRAS